MGKFYKEFALKKVLECEGLEFLKNVKVGTEVYLKVSIRRNAPFTL